MTEDRRLRDREAVYRDHDPDRARVLFRTVLYSSLFTASIVAVVVACAVLS